MTVDRADFRDIHLMDVDDLDLRMDVMEGKPYVQLAEGMSGRQQRTTRVFLYGQRLREGSLHLTTQAPCPDPSAHAPRRRRGWRRRLRRVALALFT